MPIALIFMCGGFASAFKDMGSAISCFRFALFGFVVFGISTLVTSEVYRNSSQTLTGQDLELGGGVNVLRIHQFKTEK